MKADELSFQVPFTRIRRGLKVSFLPASGEGVSQGSPTSLGKSLAMAHFFDRAMTAQRPGTLAGLAGRWGVRPQHLAQVHALVYLAPDLQEAVLLSMPEAGKLTFHSLVAIARMPLWADQRGAWKRIADPHGAESVSGGKGLSGNTERVICPQGEPRTEESVVSVLSKRPSTLSGQPVA